MRAAVATLAFMDGLQVQWLLDRSVVDMAAALEEFFRGFVNGFDDVEPTDAEADDSEARRSRDAATIAARARAVPAGRGRAGLRWGMIGAGWIAGFFAAAVHAHTAQRITAVATRSLERAEAFAARARHRDRVRIA